MNLAELMMLPPQAIMKDKQFIRNTDSIPSTLIDHDSFPFILKELINQGMSFDNLLDQILEDLSVDHSHSKDIKQLITSFIDSDDLLYNNELSKSRILDSLAESLVTYLTEQDEEITLEEVHALLKKHIIEESVTQKHKVSLEWPGITSLLNTQTPNDQGGVQQSDRQLVKMAEIIQQFSTLVQEQINEDDIKSLDRIAPKVIKLLSEWQAVFEQTSLAKNGFNQLFPDDELHEIWENLVKRFNKRTNFAKVSHYRENAKVRSTDVAKWLAHLITEKNKIDVKQHQIISPKNKQNSNMFNRVMNVSPIEQYVIYTQPTKGEPIEQQVLNQFRQIVETRSFFPYQTNINQLSMTLKPDHLGEIFVRMIEINGEITVKLLVSSQTTKRLLEANIHQLKHMFLPHQVVIEENEKVIEDLTSQDHMEEDHSKDNSKDSNDEQQQEQSSDTFTEEFQKILNEIV